MKKLLRCSRAPRSQARGAAALWRWATLPSSPKKAEAQVAKAITALPVTVSTVVPGEFVETVLVTGSLVPREEILVGTRDRGPARARGAG